MAIPADLKSKNPEELRRILSELNVELSDLKMKVATRELKDVRKLRSTKRRIAQILTLLNVS